MVLSMPLLVQAGVVVNGTRFIYSGSAEKGMSVILKNTGPERYLIQSKINNFPAGNMTKVTPQSNVPFITIPPLFSMNGYGENVVRILRVGGYMPEDRESVFVLSIAAIPSGLPESHSVQWAVRARYKLFYRPEGLKGSPQQAYKQLKWIREGTRITASNPTPYYVTLFGVKTNHVAHDDAGMVPPFATQSWEWCPERGRCELQWQAIDDYGAIHHPLVNSLKNHERT